MLTVHDLYLRRPRLESLLQELPKKEQRIELRVFDICVHARRDYEERLSQAARTLVNQVKTEDQNDPSFEHAITSQLYLRVNEFGHKPAFIFVINYDNENPTHQAHVFGGKQRSCIGKSVYDPKAEQDLLDIAYEDNAVLINKKGFIENTIVQLVNVNPSEIPRADGFGFAHDVHTRHYSSLGASYHLPGTSVYALGEAGHIRRFKEGKISFSTVDEE